MMVKWMAVLLVVAAGAWAGEPPLTRELKAERSEMLAFRELYGRGQAIAETEKRLTQEKRQLEADTAAIVSDIRAHHGILASEDIYTFSPDTGILVVGPRQGGAPIGTASLPAGGR